MEVAAGIGREFVNGRSIMELKLGYISHKVYFIALLKSQHTFSTSFAASIETNFVGPARQKICLKLPCTRGKRE
jgi:hypothetical protein